MRTNGPAVFGPGLCLDLGCINHSEHQPAASLLQSSRLMVKVSKNQPAWCEEGEASGLGAKVFLSLVSRVQTTSTTSSSDFTLSRSTTYTLAAGGDMCRAGWQPVSTEEEEGAALFLVATLQIAMNVDPAVTVLNTCCQKHNDNKHCRSAQTENAQTQLCSSKTAAWRQQLPKSDHFCGVALLMGRGSCQCVKMWRSEVRRGGTPG